MSDDAALRKLCNGLEVAPSTVFEGLELGRTDGRRELFDLIAARSEDEVALLIHVVRALLGKLDVFAAARRG
jgi:hypothetical protein